MTKIFFRSTLPASLKLPFSTLKFWSFQDLHLFLKKGAFFILSFQGLSLSLSAGLQGDSTNSLNGFRRDDWGARVLLSQRTTKQKFKHFIFPIKYVVPKSLSRLAIGWVSGEFYWFCYITGEWLMGPSWERSHIISRHFWVDDVPFPVWWDMDSFPVG